MEQDKLKIYLFLGCIFCTVVVTGNLIFQKFIAITLPLYGVIEISVGILLYPITFLISDLITEFFGSRLASYIVRVTAITSLVIIALIYIAINVNATSWSPVTNKEFSHVFNIYGIGTVASIIANWIAQSCDIAIYSFLKTLTRNKHLWLRNNVSTIIAQIADTISVLTILCFYNILPWEQFLNVMYSSIIFKTVAALIDTPFCYLFYFLIKKYFTCNRLLCHDSKSTCNIIN